MLTLNFGVVDLPYTDDPEHKTTGDVAEILEGKYHIFEVFFEVNERAIMDMVTDGLAGQLEDVLSGAPPTRDPFAAGAAEDRAGSRQFSDRPVYCRSRCCALAWRVGRLRGARGAARGDG